MLVTPAGTVNEYSPGAVKLDVVVVCAPADPAAPSTTAATNPTTPNPRPRSEPPIMPSPPSRSNPPETADDGPSLGAGAYRLSTEKW
jgi:hypothetical protein